MHHYYLWFVANALPEIASRIRRSPGNFDQRSCHDIHFHVVLLVELFLTQMMRKRTKQMVVRWRQVRRIRWMRKWESIRASIIFRRSTLEHGVLRYHANSKFAPAFPWVFGNPVQLLTVEISSDGATISKNFPVNNPIDIFTKRSPSPSSECRSALGVATPLWPGLSH